MTDAIIDMVAVGYIKMSFVALPFLIIFVMIRYFIIERH